MAPFGRPSQGHPARELAAAAECAGRWGPSWQCADASDPERDVTAWEGS